MKRDWLMRMTVNVGNCMFGFMHVTCIWMDMMGSLFVIDIYCRLSLFILGRELGLRMTLVFVVCTLTLIKPTFATELGF